LGTDVDIARPLFILAGHAPYDNKGCEAIVRGTVEILRHHFSGPRFVVASHYSSHAQYLLQTPAETDKDITHEKTLTKFEPLWFLQKGAQLFFPKLRPAVTYRRMMPYVKDSLAVLSVGGDGYSLDYGLPWLLTDLDDLIISRKKPIVIWGASVGPFSSNPRYERYMIEHLKKIDGIFVRESASMEYLTRKGVVDNVYQVADPAFLLQPIKPGPGKLFEEISREGLGINLSPLMANYVTNGNFKEWVEYAAEIVREVANTFERPLYLIPHVTSRHTNDHEFMRLIMERIGKTRQEIILLPPDLNAAETKWVISQLSVFAGARTHATIAAVSSGVPTLTMAYSIKAEGINLDIFGGLDYCIKSYDIKPAAIVRKLTEIFDNSDKIRHQINEVMPGIKSKAMHAGSYLKDIIINYHPRA
jgi:polysaccharide pyruvyl transferase WcaK-like protein